MRAALYGLIALTLAAAGAVVTVQAQTAPAPTAPKAPDANEIKTAKAIMNAAMWAGQVGLLQSFDTLPTSEEAANLAKAAAIAPERRTLKQGEVSPQFVNAARVQRAAFGELAKISFSQDGKDDMCTGVVLSNTHFIILTAAHCSCGKLDSYKIYLGDTAAFKSQMLVLGAPPERYRGYSCYLPPESQIGSDLAILRFIDPKGKKNPFETWNVTPEPDHVLVATMHDVYLDGRTKQLTGVGFGKTETGQTVEDARGGIIPIASFFCGGGGFANSACAGFREFVLAFPPGTPRPVDSCGGDSGAPIFWVAPGSGEDKTLERFLVGITSRGIQGVQNLTGLTCGGGGIYTMIGHPDVIRWLRTFDIRTRSKLYLQPKPE